MRKQRPKYGGRKTKLGNRGNEQWRLLTIQDQQWRLEQEKRNLTKNA